MWKHQFSQAEKVASKISAPGNCSFKRRNGKQNRKMQRKRIQIKATLIDKITLNANCNVSKSSEKWNHLAQSSKNSNFFLR